MTDFSLFYLPEPILNHIKQVVEKEREHSDDRIYATELAGNCLLKAFLNRRVGLKSERIQWAIYRGLIFDELWTGLFPRNQVRVTHRIPNGPTIVGRIDFIWDGKIYELKTVNSVRKIEEPLPHHVKQVKFYAWCENVDTAVIIYVSFDGIRCFDINCHDSYEIVKEFEQKAMVLYQALKTNTPPEPGEEVEEWECKYCDYYMSYCGGKKIGCLRRDW